MSKRFTPYRIDDVSVFLLIGKGFVTGGKELILLCLRRAIWLVGIYEPSFP